MEALTRPLLPSALPLELAGADIHPFDVNQGSFYVGGILTTPGAAVRLQMDLATRLRAFLDSRPNAEIVYTVRRTFRSSSLQVTPCRPARRSDCSNRRPGSRGDRMVYV